MSSAPAIDLVLFDMDGVIFEGRNFWLDLHRVYGTDREGVRLADRYLADDYAELARRVAGELWKGRPAAPFERLVAERRYQPGVRRLMEVLRPSPLATAIVSSGPLALAERARRELGFDEIRANRVETEAGVLTGRTTIQVPDGEKKRVGLEVIARLGATPARTAFVGDSDSDAPLAAAVGLPIAYNSRSQRLLAVAEHVLAYRQLGRVAALVGVGGRSRASRARGARVR